MANNSIDFENVSPGHDDEMEAFENAGDIEIISFGNCNHCGEGVMVEPCLDQDEADAAATAKCACKAGKKARKAAEAEDDPPR